MKIRTEVSNLENELVKSLRTLVQGLIPTDSTLCPHGVSTTIIKRRRQRTKVMSYSRSKLAGVPSWIEWFCGGGNYMHYNYNISLCLSAFSFCIFPSDVIVISFVVAAISLALPTFQQRKQKVGLSHHNLPPSSLPPMPPTEKRSLICETKRRGCMCCLEWVFRLQK